MKLFWKLYSLLFLLIVSSNLLQLLDQHSLLEVYYKTTIVFSRWLILPYTLNILNIVITYWSAFFVFGYAFDVQALSLAPRWLFYLRIFCECTGHSFEWNMIKSEFAQEKTWGLIALALLILPILPSYIAQWRLTFKKKTP